MISLGERLEQFVGTWEPSLARQFFQYDRLLRSKTRCLPSAWGKTEAGPYWKELPRWLAERRGNGQSILSPAFLDAVLWGQICLFYAVRLQDDMLDGGLSRSPLTMAPLLFLTEAGHAFSTALDTKTGIWEQYRRALERTVSGVTRVAELQRNPAAPADDLLAAYGCVDAVLSVASSAVCEHMGAVEDIPRVNDFVGELGKVLLALDDAEDIEEDLKDGRLNYAARILLEPDCADRTELPSLAKTWQRHTRAKGFEEIRQTLLACLARAAGAIASLELPQAMDLIEAIKSQVCQVIDADAWKRRNMP